MTMSESAPDVLYVTGQTMAEGQAGHTHVVEVVNGLRSFGMSVRLLHNTYRKQRPSIAARLIAFAWLNLRCACTIAADRLRRRRLVVYIRHHFLLFPVSFVCTVLRVPSVAEVCGPLSDALDAWPWIRPFGKMLQLISIMQCNLAARVVAVSDRMKEFVVEQYRVRPQRVAVIPNGANVQKFRPLDKARCRTELDLNPDDYYVCFVGALASWQGVDVLVESAKILVSQLRTVTVLVVGDGAMKPELVGRANELGVADRVRFVGTVSYDKVPTYIGASDLCVAPFGTSKPASPLKVYEYLACERAVVTSGIAEATDLVAENECGLVFPAGDAEELAKAITRLLGDPDLCRRMGERGRKLVCEHYSWRATARKVMDVILQVASRRIAGAD